MVVLELFVTFLGIGAVSFGGGWSIVGVIENVMVSKGWMDHEGFQHIIAISQISPGPVSLTAATLVGFERAGIVGAISASAAMLIPGIAFLLIGTILINRLRINRTRLAKALSIGGLVLLGFTVVRLFVSAMTNWWVVGIAVVVGFLFVKTKIPAALIILGGIGVGIVAKIFLEVP